MQNIRINRKQPNTFYQKSMFSKAIIQKVVLDRGNHLSDDIARKTLDVRFQGLVGRNVSFGCVQGDIGEHNLLFDIKRNKYCFIDLRMRQPPIHPQKMMRGCAILTFYYMINSSTPRFSWYYSRLKYKPATSRRGIRQRQHWVTEIPMI